MSVFLFLGAVAREEMIRSKLPNSVLRRIWALSDIDEDGMLDRDEFAVAMFLIDHKLGGNDIPEMLPERMIPPSKRLNMRSSGRIGGGGSSGSAMAARSAYSGYSGSGNSYSYSSKPMDEYTNEDVGGLGSYIDHN